jgi:hypothetical protein
MQSRLAILRAVLILHLLAAATQAVLAGQFLSGLDHSVAFHEQTGWGVAVLGLVQILTIVIFRSPRGDVMPFLLSSILILLAELLELGTGYGRFLSVHVPLGAMILAGLTAQLVWVFR